MKNEQKQKVTRGQIGRIVSLLTADKVSFEEAQEFIDRFSVKKPRAVHSQDEILAYWESKFPGAGESLASFFRPFYDWKPEVMPAFPNLEQNVRDGIFWREVKRTELVHVSYLESLRVSLRESFLESYRGDIAGSFFESIVAAFGTLRWEKLSYQIGVSGICVPHVKGLGNELDSMIASAFREILYCYACLVLTGRFSVASKFELLRQLWLTGNFPLGFDKKGNLLVLVA